MSSERLSIAGVSAVAARVVAMIAQFFCYATVGNIFGAETTGLFAIALAVLSLSAVAAKFGADVAIIRLVGRTTNPQEQRRAAAAALLFVGATSFAIGGVLFFIRGSIAAGLESGELAFILPAVALAVPPFSVLWVTGGIWQGYRRITTSILLRDVLPFLLIAFFLIVSGNHLRWVILPAAFTVALVLSTALLLRWTPGFSLAVDTEDLRRLLRAAAPLSVVGLTNAAVQRVDVLIIGLFLPTAAVGVYAVASKVALTIVSVLIAFGNVFSPLAALLYAEGEKRRLQQQYEGLSSLVMACTLPLALVYFLAPEAILSLFGSDFRNGGTVLQILVIAQVITVLPGPAGYLLMMIGRGALEAWNTTVLLLSFTICGVLLVSRLGLLGAAVAMAASAALVAAMRAWQVRRVLGAKMAGSKIGWLLLLGASICGIALLSPLGPAWRAASAAMLYSAMAVYFLPSAVFSYRVRTSS